MEKAKVKKIEVVLQPISVGTLNVKIKGKTPLLMDRMPEEVKEGVLAKQSGIAKGNKKQTRETDKETRNAVHTTQSGKIGFPAFGFKKGMMECTSFVGDKAFSKKLVSGAVNRN